ncbi:MAG: hypothetical protein HQL50_16325 [Magnetococcales bacterium]|nr:hypothetical protein [Magnetococcales bacterium]
MSKKEDEMIILGIHTGHDGAAALFVEGELVAYCKEERLSRKKSDGHRLTLSSIDEVLEIAGIERSQIDVACLSRMNLPLRHFKRTSMPIRNIWRGLRGKTRSLGGEMTLLQEPDPFELVHEDLIRQDLGLRDDARITFANHHYTHVLGAFKYTTWEKDALYISADGGGDGTTYAAYGWDGETLTCLYGGEEFLIDRKQKSAASIGLAYQSVTKHLGFRPNRHEGKITGLAAFGKPIIGDRIRALFTIHPDGSFDAEHLHYDEVMTAMAAMEPGISREDLASSIQYALEVVILDWVEVLRKRFPARYIGMSGGVFSNVRLNQKVAELPGVEEAYIFPGMGDEGLPVGNCVHMEIETAGLQNLKRGSLPNAYLGRCYDCAALTDAAEKRGGFRIQTHDDPSAPAAELLSHGRIGAIFSQRMEMGPRALGARSIMAAPVKKSLNDTLNGRLNRTEFMPFAPFVLDEDAERVFVIDDTNREACRFMTITTDVREAFHGMMPAVVHVDGTARPQIIERETNPLYYDTLKEYRDRTGIPCLVNTSFNAHEEPIINTPDEALTALADGRIDFLVCETALIFSVKTADAILDTP